MRALITGGAVRLGRAVATALHEAGFSVALHYRASSGAARSLAEEFGGALLVQADLSTVEGCASVVDAVNRWGGVDVLVNSAAAWEACPVEQIDPVRWDAMQALNVRAPFLLTQGLLASLRASELPGGGLVLNITDIAGERPARGYAHYNVSKAGLTMLTRTLALELAPQVRVNGIAPGTVLPPEELPDEQLIAIRDTIPAGRFGTARDIARAAIYFALHAPYVTGQVLAVDGGRSVGGPMEAG